MHIDGDFMDKKLGIDRNKMAEDLAEKAKQKYKESREQRKQEEPDWEDPEDIDFDPEDDSFLFESSFSAANKKEPVVNSENDEIDFEEDGDDDEWGKILDEDEQEEQELEFATPPKVRHEKDYRVFPNGPYQSQVNSWKKQYKEVYMTDMGGIRFVWRPINRYEYKEIVATANTDPLMREEMICETCVLHPENYTFESMANGKGGTPAALSETIMEKSDFTRNFEVKRL